MIGGGEVFEAEVEDGGEQGGQGEGQAGRSCGGFARAGEESEQRRGS